VSAKARGSTRDSSISTTQVEPPVTNRRKVAYKKRLRSAFRAQTPAPSWVTAVALQELASPPPGKTDKVSLVHGLILLSRKRESRMRRSARPAYPFPELDKHWIGKKLGHVTLIARMPERHSFWSGRCECGVVREYRLSDLISGDVTSCGCARLSGPTNANQKYQSGMRFGGFTLMEKIISRPRYWVVRHDACGTLRNRQVQKVVSKLVACIGCPAKRRRK
jgi:hypothetical protein